MSWVELLANLDKKRMPKHVGVIMDGNGRWARSRGGVRLDGHRKGTDAVRSMVEAAVEIGLANLTIYAFSTENWQRPQREVKGLLKLILDSLLSEIDTLHKNGVNMHFIGSLNGIDAAYRQKLDDTCAKTWGNKGLRFTVCVNYGGRTELAEAFNALAARVATGELTLPITPEQISASLYTVELPDPDLIIRTSGEERLSNFMVWQAAYAELWFTPTLWPDFTKEEFVTALLDYQKRQRRWGKSS